MTELLSYTIVDGIKCYSSDVAGGYQDYPDEGFDLTDSEAGSSFWILSRNRLFKRLVRQNMLSTGTTRLFEVGCGTGSFLRELADVPDLAIVGSEIYRKGLVYAQATLPGVELIQYDVTKGVTGSQFELVAAFDVLEHIERDRQAMENVHAMLADGGRFILSVPQYQFLWSPLDDLVKHKRRYSRSDMTDKLKAAGFEIRYTTSFVFTLFPLMLAARLADKKNKAQVNEGAALAKRVHFPAWQNWLFDRIMRLDEVLIGLGLSLPFGGTLVVVAEKPKAMVA